MNRGSLKFLGKILISAFILYFVFRKLDFSEVWKLVTRANPLPLLAALAFFLLSQWVSSLRLDIFWKGLNIYMSQRANWRLYLLGMFYNLLLPGGVGGDGYKLLRLHQDYGVKKRNLFFALLADRISGLLALIGLAVLGLVYFLERPFAFYPLALLIIYPFSYFILIRIKKEFVSLYFPTLGFSFVIQGLQVLSAVFILYALGMQENILIYLILFLLSSVAAVIPITFGGAGARELTFLLAAPYFSIELNVAIALSLLFYITTLVVSLSGIYYSFKSYK